MPMNYSLSRGWACCVCGLDTFRHKGWFLVVENRWLDRLKILSWHSSLASQPTMKSVCCKQHLKTLIAHWLMQASLRLPPACYPPLPISSDPGLGEVEFGSEAVGRLVGELAVHRESFSRVWSGSSAALEGILDAIITVGAENQPQPLEFHLSDSPKSAPRLSLQ
jgi:hypothetical protein